MIENVIRKLIAVYSGDLKVQIHVITGTATNRYVGGRHVITAQLHVLTGEKTQTTGPGCFQVEQGDIIVDDGDVFDFGCQLLLWDFAGTERFWGFQHYIRHLTVNQTIRFQAQRVRSPGFRFMQV